MLAVLRILEFSLGELVYFRQITPRKLVKLKAPENSVLSLEVTAAFS